MTRRSWLAAVAGALLFAAAGTVAASADTGTATTIYACVSSTQHFTNVNVTAPPSCPAGSYGVSWTGNLAAPAPTPTPTPTAPSPTASPSPSPSAAACTASLGQNCGPYFYAPIPMSNGYDTYVMNQSVNPAPGTTQVITATDPGSWSVVASDVTCGGCVQTFTAVQQLTNDWNGSGWGGATADTPLASLSALKVSYSETTPRDPGTQAEFAPDVWDSSAAADVMFWADTTTAGVPSRCGGNGLNSSDILGQAILDGQNWTVYHFGAEVIFILDGISSTDPVATNTCAQQTSGTIDILGGYKWLVAHGVQHDLGNLTQLNTGWEITSADNTTFTMNSYSISAA